MTTSLNIKKIFSHKFVCLEVTLLITYVRIIIIMIYRDQESESEWLYMEIVWYLLTII
jgi:hypothetical protein